MVLLFAVIERQEKTDVQRQDEMEEGQVLDFGTLVSASQSS